MARYCLWQLVDQQQMCRILLGAYTTKTGNIVSIGRAHVREPAARCFDTIERDSFFVTV